MGSRIETYSLIIRETDNAKRRALNKRELYRRIGDEQEVEML